MENEEVLNEQINQKSQIEIDNEAFEEECKKTALKISEREGKEVEYHIWFERDKDGNQTGKRYKAFTRKPHIMVLVKAMDLLVQGRFHEAGLAIFPSSFIEDASDSIISDNDDYKVALCGRLGIYLKSEAPELKKS